MPDEVLWFTPLKFSIILEAYREIQKQKMIMAAQSAIFNGAVVRSYFGGGKGRRVRPITKINQLIRFDDDDDDNNNSRKTDALSRIKTVEQYNEKLNNLREIIKKAKNKNKG